MAEAEGDRRRWLVAVRYAGGGNASSYYRDRDVEHARQRAHRLAGEHPTAKVYLIDLDAHAPIVAETGK